MQPEEFKNIIEVKSTKAQRIGYFLLDKENMVPILKDKIKEHEAGIRFQNKRVRDYQKMFDNGEKITITSKYHRKIQMSDVISLKLMVQDSIKEHQDCIKRYEGYLRRANGVINKHQKDFDVDRIKEEMLIGDLMPDSPKFQTSTRSKYLCPLHNENTPSFTVYHDKNTFHCFGCGAGYSVIDLYMKLNNVDFIQACKELTKLYM